MRVCVCVRFDVYFSRGFFTRQKYYRKSSLKRIYGVCVRKSAYKNGINSMCHTESSLFIIWEKIASSLPDTNLTHELS